MTRVFSVATATRCGANAHAIKGTSDDLEQFIRVFADMPQSNRIIYLGSMLSPSSNYMTTTRRYAGTIRFRTACRLNSTLNGIVNTLNHRNSEIRMFRVNDQPLSSGVNHNIHGLRRNAAH